MPEPAPDETARRHDALNRDRFALRRSLRAMTADEHRLARRMVAFEARERSTAHTIERSWRTEHWGKEPERPWAWHEEPRD